MTDAIGYGILWHWCRVTPGAPDGERFARSFWQALFNWGRAGLWTGAPPRLHSRVRLPHRPMNSVPLSEP